MQLLCIGDIALANKNLIDGAWMPPAGLIPGEDAKLLFNWEFPIGEDTNPNPRVRGMRFLAYPESELVLQKWSPGIATLANNHVLDAGNEGLVHTMERLQKAGFLTVGAGQSVDEISRPLIWETAEGRLGIINWVFAETHPDWMAVPGPHCWPGVEEAKRMVQALKSQVDWVLVVVHWSDELFSYPTPEDRAVARELAQMGVDVIVGHHPHAVRGMEMLSACPVFYSVGNFYFADIPDESGGWISQEAPRNREALGVQITFRRGKNPECKTYSFWNTSRKVVTDPLGRAIRRFENSSRPLQLQGSQYADWYAAERARFDQWGSRWYFGVLRLGLGGTLRRLWQKISGKG
jgi:hypothetical protein